MKLARVKFEGRATPALVEDDRIRLLETESIASALSLVASGQDLPLGARIPAGSAELLAPIDNDAKFFCIGLNYYTHMAEAKLPKPRHPIVFSKYPSALIGPADDVLLPNTSKMVDWEAELGVVVGRRLREADEEQAARAIGGFTVVNDVSARDYQVHESQWIPGKNIEASTPVGPWIVTVDELDPNPDLALSTRVDGEVRQDGRTTDQIFTPAQILAYISEWITLEPGDIVATGTCAGVGHCMTPPVYLGADQVLETTIERVGTLTNRCVGGRVVAVAPALT
ncbi:acylpyruvate hydrolase [Amycolatopsis sulphurea]|uniref:Acylpyruvate hydrolase n=1 Tax=Amycolatopsis sulphurea TaxID=76022 RepID=A0A2A9FHI2_9PSEU|nr:fumarylacetoacetate hydrolase family protein [Amycolatopsis sulphurea]PFG49970.1 acylpyruvate hydrolase [Amycolatopsis sulphurea]